jgi:integrase
VSGAADGAAAASCPMCLAWGILYAGVCRGCYDFTRRHRAGTCACCLRVLPLKKGYCRPCWLQAALQAAVAAGTAKRAPDLGPADFAAVTCHQLFFAGLAKMNHRPRPPRQPDAGPPPPEVPAAGWTQLELSVPGQSRRFHARHWAASAITSPQLEAARAIAARLGEARGWNPRIRAETNRALTVMLAAHFPGEKIPWSALGPALRPRDLSISRTAEILTLAGLLEDDRVPALDAWAESKLAGLAPGIAACARSWLRALRDGTPRSRPRKPDTIRRYLRCVHPVLADWSARYGHLREVTASDITAALATLRGHKRHQALVALRSLTRHCKKAGLIFADPAARIRATRRPETMILPLGPAQISAATHAAATPAARLALALAAVHAARPEAIRALALGDLDLGNRRITIAGACRPLDDLTRRLILTWLDHRRDRWPDTANPYLIINNQTAMSTHPVSENWLTEAFRGLDATLERLRIDRQLDEALTCGPDPLHLAAVFGLDDTTAIRYATAARQLLDTPGGHDPAGSARTRGSTPLAAREAP